MLTGFLMLAALLCAAERPTTDKLTAAATTTMRMNISPPRMRLVIPVVVLERDRFMRLKSVGDSVKLTLLQKIFQEPEINYSRDRRMPSPVSWATRPNRSDSRRINCV